MIFKEISALLFDPDVPNAIITDQITHELIKYLDEHVSVELFQPCLAPHDLFDLLDLTSNADALQSDLLPLARLSIDDQISLSTDRTVRRRIGPMVEQIGTTGVDARTIDLHSGIVSTDPGNFDEIFDQEERRRIDDDR